MLRIIFCIAIVSGLTAHAQTEGLEVAVKQYLDCARLAVPSLDDTTSDAATVAIGLHAQCRPTLADVVGLNAERQDSITQRLRPSLVQYVLLYRVGKRRNSKV